MNRFPEMGNFTHILYLSFFAALRMTGSGIVGLASFIAWTVLMIAAHRGRYYKLPLFGDLAERLMNRIRL